MFDTLYIGTSGLLSNAQGLKVVSNNLANVNTPGFKGSQLQFSDLFEQGSAGSQHGGAQATVGAGVGTLGARLNFKPGNDQSTGNPLDLSINGNGLFVVKRDGQLLYTRSGNFQFNADNVLTNSAGDHVQALGSGGQLTDVTLDMLGSSAPQATATIKFSGNLTSTVAVPPVDASVSGVTIIDAAGASHSVTVTLKDAGGGSYNVSINEGTATGVLLGSGSIKFTAGVPVAGSDAFTFQYTSTGGASFPVKLDFSKNVTSLLTPSTLSMNGQDGHVAGVRTDQSIDPDGTISVRYSNGQTAKGARLALAQFNAEGDLEQVGSGAFAKQPGSSVQYGYAGGESNGSLVAGHLEGSNVDLAEEFSNLIVMQRGYQASSHVISTVNDMIQELFDMKGHR